MLNRLIQMVLILLLIFTPIAFGSMPVWAFSLMEMGILLVIILWSVDFAAHPLSTFAGRHSSPRTPPSELSSSVLSSLRTWNSEVSSSLHSDSAFRIPHSEFSSSVSSNSELSPRLKFPMAMLFLFLGLILFQMVSLPPGWVKLISPKAYELHRTLSLSSSSVKLSLYPFATRIEFIKWVTLSGLFLVLLNWKGWREGPGIRNGFLIAVFLTGVFEALYGMFEFFSGHHQILYLKGLLSSVTGTFINRNYFAGYLLMVIPLSAGFLLSRDAFQRSRIRSWRHRIATLDGKSLLIGFGIVVMVLSLLFSASRMGIASLLFSFAAVSLFLRDPGKKGRFSKRPLLLLILAVLWGAWIGLDTVMDRFFTSSEDFRSRREMWSDTLRIVQDFPVVGSGLGSFVQVFPMYQSFHEPGISTHAENDFLQLASETGWLGIGVLSILFLTLFFKAASGMRLLSHGEPERYIGTGGLVGIMALMLHSLVERNIQVPANAFLYAFIFAMVLQMAMTPKTERRTPE
jgi:O-antigen ligase